VLVPDPEKMEAIKMMVMEVVEETIPSNQIVKPV
jgi:hypothetical protein